MVGQLFGASAQSALARWRRLMYSHLLDGDIASNYLSWQWVSATGSSKPYLFNAENVEKFAPPAWFSRGTVLDTTYETIEIWRIVPRVDAIQRASI